MYRDLRKRHVRTVSCIVPLVVCVFFVMAVLFAGMDSASAAQGSQKMIKIRLSNGLAIGTYQNTILIPAFIKEVKEKTNGSVTVENYPAGQLFGHTETADALRRGAVDMGFSSLNHFVGYSPIMAFNDYAFLINSVEAWKNNYDETFKITDQILNKIGVKLLSFVPYSDTVIISKKPINTPADCKGQRIRGISDPFFDCIKAWGGVPAAMTPSEAYDAMAKGSLDGIMSGWDSAKSRKYFEIAGYASGPTAAPIWAYVMNLNNWKSLPKEVQQVIQQAANNSSNEGIAGQEKADEEVIRFLKANKMQVKVFTPAEVTMWKKATLPAYDMFLERATDKGAGDVAKRLLEIYNK